jgi:lipopolysaccharide export system protein LptA
MTVRFATLALSFGLILAGAMAPAQQASIAFGGLKQDPTLPVEVSADQLAVDQGDGSATFSGNVKVAQGQMRLAAGTIRVEYATDSKAIARLDATGGVTFASQTDAAESQEAVYTIASGQIVMTGDVLLTQGQTALSGQKLVINLKAGTGVMEGRVTTVFKPGGN